MIDIGAKMGVTHLPALIVSSCSHLVLLGKDGCRDAMKNILIIWQVKSLRFSESWTSAGWVQLRGPGVTWSEFNPATLQEVDRVSQSVSLAT